MLGNQWTVLWKGIGIWGSQWELIFHIKCDPERSSHHKLSLTLIQMSMWVMGFSVKLSLSLDQSQEQFFPIKSWAKVELQILNQKLMSISAFLHNCDSSLKSTLCFQDTVLQWLTQGSRYFLAYVPLCAFFNSWEFFCKTYP